MEINVGSLVSVPPVHFGRSQITGTPAAVSVNGSMPQTTHLRRARTAHRFNLLVAEFS
jgi:hypothetical protein